ncbi:amino acid ABC transporter ATP-binding protein [Kibdelosporangium aridum]|uniref:amino acid ABC transporter ATP-binding protein n=1 Tax=Kibdelosporangium aridum TaxID=2030 RepID=UPI0035E6DB90
MVKAEGVCKRFGSLEVLKGIDLEVQPGEVMCIIGPSGSGKSTFLRCINHLEKVDAGRLSVDGDLVGYEQRGDKLYELRENEVAQKRQEIGMVFQRFNLFPHMTALENVIEAPVQVKGESKASARERGVALLHQVGLGDKTTSYPRQLSGGQQQRVAIARALAMQPQADAVRRADLRTGPGAGRRGAQCDASARQGRHDHGGGHARDGVRS